MKKLLSILICILLLTGVMFVTACEKKEPDTTDMPQVSTTDDITINSDTNKDVEESSTQMYKLSDTPVTLSVFTTTRPMVDDFVNNEFTKWLEMETNIEFEFITVPENEGKMKLNLLLSSGDYPELILPLGLLTRSEVSYYGKQGIFIELNDLIENYGVNTKEVFSQYPDARKFVTMEEGKIYTLPDVGVNLHMSDTWKMWVYQPWLDKLGLEAPTTTDELVAVLRAFKEQDPNGNNKQDEIPMAGSLQNWCASPNIFLMNAFIYDDGGERIWIEKNKVDVTYTKDQYKEGLKFIKSLVDEGLLAKESFTQDMNALIQIGENPDAHILGFSFGGYEGCFADLSNEKWMDYAISPALTGPSGTRLAPYNFNYAYQIGNEITDICENPEVAFKLLDMFYDREVLYKKEFGVEGRDWRRAIEGETGYAGPAVFMPLVEYGTLPKNVIWDQNGVQFQNEAFRIGQIVDVEVNPMEKILFEGTRDLLKPAYPDLDNLFPNVLPTTEETVELSTLTTDLTNYVDEMTARFVTGDVDIDSGWEDYLDQLDALNLSRYLELKQAIYDRYDN